MKNAISIALLLLLSAPAAAQGPIVLTGLAAGKAYLLVQSADGQWSAVEVTQIVEVSAPVPPPPPPPKPTTLEATVIGLTKAVVDPTKPQTAAAVSRIYSAVADLGRQGQLSRGSDIALATDALWSPTMAAAGKAAAWQAWKNGVDKATAGLVSLSDYVAAWDVIAKAVAEGAK